MNPIFILFAVVFLLNLIPAFAPPTWMVFSYLGFRFPSHMGWNFALAGAIAATMGRSLLAQLSRLILRRHWLTEAARSNVDSLKAALQDRPKMTFGLFLFYAFTPLPSNYLFIAYGLTTMPLARLAAPFFLGRFVSYSLWTFSAAAVSRKLALEDTEALAYFSVYFVLTQIALLALVYVFTKIDWNFALQQQKLRWLPKPNRQS